MRAWWTNDAALDDLLRDARGRRCWPFCAEMQQLAKKQAEGNTVSRVDVEAVLQRHGFPAVAGEWPPQRAYAMLAALNEHQPSVSTHPDEDTQHDVHYPEVPAKPTALTDSVRLERLQKRNALTPAAATVSRRPCGVPDIRGALPAVPHPACPSAAHHPIREQQQRPSGAARNVAGAP